MLSDRGRAALLGVLLAAPSASGEVVERILAVVDSRPLLLSEARILEAVRGVDRAAAVEALIDERLMFAEAAKLPQSAVSAEEEQKAYESLVSGAGDRARAVPETDLRGLARREATILKYVHFRFLPQIRVTDEAVQKAYDAETGEKEGALPFEDAAPGLRQRLIDHELDLRIESWVKELRAGSKVRYNPGEGP